MQRLVAERAKGVVCVLSKCARPSHADTLAVMRHLADVATLRSDPATQRQLLVDGLNSLLDTHCGFFYVADRWRATGEAHFSQQTLTTERDDAAFAYMANFGTRYPLEDDPFCYASMRDERPIAGWTLGDVLPDDDAKRRFHAIMDLVGTTRWRDGIVTHFRCGDRQDRIVGVSLHRLGDARPLAPRQRAILRLAVEELSHLAKRGHFVLPDLSRTPDLPPRLRQVLDRLLAGRQPKAIAHELRLSVHTVREHVQRLYRHFGVSGREELMARFVK